MSGGRLRAGSILLALAVGFVGMLEGRSLSAYLDGGGVPTICYGSTRAVKMGQTATAAECDKMFTADLIRHESEMLGCLKRPGTLPNEVYLAVLSFTYNVGGAAACGSTLFKKLNAGDLRGACDQLPRWVNDNGRVIPGLIKRRVAERDLCLSALQ